jgi:hypothetical protein
VVFKLLLDEDRLALMKTSPLLALLVLCLPSCSAGTAVDQPSRSLTDLVASFGSETRPDDLKELRGSGRDAIRLLIATLQPIPEETVPAEDKKAHRAALQVVWAVRALRYLTGKDFRAPTAHWE